MNFKNLSVSRLLLFPLTQSKPYQELYFRKGLNTTYFVFEPNESNNLFIEKTPIFGAGCVIHQQERENRRQIFRKPRNESQHQDKSNFHIYPSSASK